MTKLSKAALEVVRGMAKGGKLSRLAPDEVRLDFPNGSYRFIDQTIIDELVKAGRLLPSAVPQTAEPQDLGPFDFL